MSIPVSGDVFEEDLSDLIELNGYHVVKMARSDDGGSEMIATKTDEVGHKVTYIIRCRRSEAPISDAEVEGSAKARERHPGSICVIASPSAGFSRSAADLAERQGVRLWGPGEIERLRRNVAEKRGVRQREVVERSDLRGQGKKRGLKRKFLVLLLIILILCIAFLYNKFFGAGSFSSSISHMRDLFEGTGLGDQELLEIFARRAQEAFREVFDAADRILGSLTQKITQLNISAYYRNIK